MRVMVVNPGSATLKLALVDMSAAETAENSETVGADAIDEVASVAARWQPLDAVGVRYVHGGPKHLEPVLLDDDVLAELDEVADLAPLHNPMASAAARALRQALRDVPVVACFDTTFHATMPPEAYTYALPREWNERWALRRYGFHGLSHEHAARAGAAAAGRSVEGTRIVTCHLGGGASLAAVVDGRSVDTTMGMTPLAGLVMQRRSGSIDPGMVLWLQQHGGLTAEEVRDGLEHHSGLAGLTGTSGDFREVLEGARLTDPESGEPEPSREDLPRVGGNGPESGEAEPSREDLGRVGGSGAESEEAAFVRDCRLALDIYLHRLVREIGAMAASAGGLDVLVFTGGVGENVEFVRATTTTRLAHLQPFDTVVVEAREDLAIAEATRRLVTSDADSSRTGATRHTYVTSRLHT